MPGVNGVLRQWPWVVLPASLAIILVAHGFETFGRMAPCELCLKERQVYWAAAGVALVGGLIALRVPRLLTWTCAILALVFVGGAGLAAYHAGVEWKWWAGPESCTGTHVRISVADMERLLHGGSMAIPRCDKPAFVFLGLSMAGWNALLSVALAAISAAATLFNLRRADF
jgi:disulfide bond formation protein DsbB